MFKHLNENNETYRSHLKFALTIGLNLIAAGIIFIVHGIFPFITVPAKLNLYAIKEKILSWYDYAEKRKR